MRNSLKNQKRVAHAPPKRRSSGRLVLLVGFGMIVVAVLFYQLHNRNAATSKTGQARSNQQVTSTGYEPTELWLHRAYAIDALYHVVYTPCWEGAYGAIGDAYLFEATHDSSILRFHLIDHDLRHMCTGRWVDDRAWVCLAELYWWNVTGRTNLGLVEDAKLRYLDARRDGRLSHHEGFWSWYNWSPSSATGERIFTNSNMNQMANVACWLYEATGDQLFLRDALLVWDGDHQYPGIEKTLYRGNGKWEGASGSAAFGKQLPWEGAEYCSIGASLYRVTNRPDVRAIVIATAKRITDPNTGWLDPVDYYQISMDGNGAFVNFLLDAYATAPSELQGILPKVEKMLDHVWTNHHGTARVELHRLSDNGIRNGWNPWGGEQGYGVNEVGTVHAQAEAVRAFGIFAYYKYAQK